MVSVFNCLLHLFSLKLTFSAMKFEKNIYKADTFLAVAERTWDIVDVRFYVEKIALLQ